MKCLKCGSKEISKFMFTTIKKHESDMTLFVELGPFYKCEKCKSVGCRDIILLEEELEELRTRYEYTKTFEVIN